MYVSEDNGGRPAALTGTIPSARGRLPFAEHNFVGGGPDLVFIVLPGESEGAATPAPAREIIEMPALPVPANGESEPPAPQAATDEEREATETAVPLPDPATGLPILDEILSLARDRFVFDSAIDSDFTPPSAAADLEPEAQSETALPIDLPSDAAVALPTIDELLSRVRGRFVLDDAIGHDFMPLPEKVIPVLFLPQSGDLLPIDPLFGG